MSIGSVSFPKVSTYEQSHSNFFKDILYGDKAFYKQSNYLDATRQDFAQSKPLPVNYLWNTEYKIIRIAKQILSIIIFPIGIYKLLHALVGKEYILPASNPSLMGISKDYTEHLRSHTSLESEWKYKRITVEVDGYKIDAVIMGKESTLNNGRWMLASNGNGAFYEQELAAKDCDVKALLGGINGNAIVFNYPGVGASSGLPNRQAMTNAYRAMLTLLEDQKNGIGAKEIIGYGHSIGGGVQGDALKTHKLKEDVRYVFVKSRTFSDLSTIASALTIKPLGFLVKILGWNMGSVESSKKLQVPEIIMQKVSFYGLFCLGFLEGALNLPVQEVRVGDGYVDLKKVQQVIFSEDFTHTPLEDCNIIANDGVIPGSASLAGVLLQDKGWSPRENQIFIGISETHTASLKDSSCFAGKIEELLISC